MCFPTRPEGTQRVPCTAVAKCEDIHVFLLTDMQLAGMQQPESPGVCYYNQYGRVNDAEGQAPNLFPRQLCKVWNSGRWRGAASELVFRSWWWLCLQPAISEKVEPCGLTRTSLRAAAALIHATVVLATAARHSK